MRMTRRRGIRFAAYRIKDTSIYLFRASIASLIGARNPHVLCVHSGFSGSVRLALEPLMAINRGVRKILRSVFLVIDAELFYPQSYHPLSQTKLRGGFCHIAFGAFQRLDNHFMLYGVESLLE